VVKGDDIPSDADIRNVEIKCRGDRIDDRDALGHVKFHLGHLVVRQPPRLEQNMLGNSNFADVVKRNLIDQN
jgi:hypothetical protein